MNEVTDDLLKKQADLLKKSSKPAFKITFKLTELSAKGLALALKALLAATDGLIDIGADIYNENKQKAIEEAKVRVENGQDYEGYDKDVKLLNSIKNKDGTEKHTHIVAKGNRKKDIEKTAERKNQTLEIVSITDKHALKFETTARNYGIQYGFHKIQGSNPPEIQVYFMAKDRHVMQMAFNQYTKNILTNAKETPKQKLQRATSRIKTHLAPDKLINRNRQRGAI